MVISELLVCRLPMDAHILLPQSIEIIENIGVNTANTRHWPIHLQEMEFAIIIRVVTSFAERLGTGYYKRNHKVKVKTVQTVQTVQVALCTIKQIQGLDRG